MNRRIRKNSAARLRSFRRFQFGVVAGAVLLTTLLMWPRTAFALPGGAQINPAQPLVPIGNSVAVTFEIAGSDGTITGATVDVSYTGDGTVVTIPTGNATINCPSTIPIENSAAAGNIRVSAADFVAICGTDFAAITVTFQCIGAGTVDLTWNTGAGESEVSNAGGNYPLDGGFIAGSFECGSAPAADVGITNSVAPTTIIPGDVVTYTLTFSNNGPDTATNVAIDNTVPGDVFFTHVTSSTVGAGVLITQTSGGANPAFDVSNLAVGEGGTITITASTNPSLMDGVTITITGDITASNDITLTNNSADAAFTTMPPPPNLLVDTLVDENDGDFNAGDNSLREAIANARDGDTITFDPALSGGTITLGGNQLEITKSIGISASIPISVSANNQSRVFSIFEPTFTFTDTPSVHLHGLTIRDGFASDDQGNFCNSSDVADACGGAVFVNSGVVTITYSTIISNAATTFAGGIVSFAQVNVIASTLADNTAADGGAIVMGGDDPDDGLTMSRSTVSGNTGTGDFPVAIVLITPAELDNSTVSNNTGGGLFVINPADVAESIIANNPAGADCVGAVTSSGNNIDSDGSCNFISAGDQSGVDPLLEPLADNGGPTMTHALLAGSPAINAGPAGGRNTTDDQRGEPQNGVRDIGAYERQGTDSFTGAAGSDQMVRAERTFANPLELTIVNDAGEPIGPGGLVIFTAPAMGASLISETITATTNMSGEVSITVTANAITGTYNVTATVNGIAGGQLYTLTNTLPNLVVSTLEDENDGDLSNGNNSLREAIAAADDGDVISFDPALGGIGCGFCPLGEDGLMGPGLPPGVGTTITLSPTLGALQITKNITIDGHLPGPGYVPGSDAPMGDLLPFGLVTVSGGYTTQVFIIGDTMPVTVTLEELSIVEGYSDSAGGAGIEVRNGHLNLYDSIVADNLLESDALGGGLSVSLDGSANIERVSFHNNVADGGFAPAPFGSDPTLEEIAESHRARSNSSSRNALMTGSGEWGGGGAIGISGTVAITDTYFFSNTARGSNGVDSGAGGGAITNWGELSVYRSTFERNSADDAFFGGGAIDNVGFAAIGNSTFAYNSAVGNTGGAVNNDGFMFMGNNTFSRNTADLGAVTNFVDLLVGNTIMADSFDGPDCVNFGVGAPPAMIDGTNNLIETDGSAVLTCAGADIVSSDDPMLPGLSIGLPGPFGLGGPFFFGTPVMIPETGSPAINAGDNATCIPEDQRMVARPEAGTCDIGSVEVQVPILDVSKSVDNAAPQTSDTITYTIVITNEGNGFASGVVAVDELPETGVEFAGTDSCSAAVGSTVTCTIGTLFPGQTVTRTIVATVTVITPTTTLTNTVDVTATEALTPAMDSATFTLANTPPVAVNDSYMVDEDTTLTTTVATGVLNNDSDDNMQSLTAQLVEDVAEGTLELAITGQFTYTPSADFNGIVTFTYQAFDSMNLGNTATVTITVNPVNDPPTAVDNEYTTDEDVELTGNVIVDDTGDGADDDGGDGGALSIDANTVPMSGTLELDSTGAFTYTPAMDESGVVTFTYSISDGTDTSNTATVTITINAVNDLPVATNDVYETDEDTPLSGNVITDDTGNGVDTDGGDGGAITIDSHTPPMNGTFTISTTGAFVYTPTADFNGEVTFTYTLTDEMDVGNTATVTITVNAVNDLPTAVDNEYTTAEDTDVMGNVILDDTGDGADDDGGDGGPMLIDSNSNPASGTLDLVASGAFTYTPAADFNGVVTWTYSITDGDVSNTATVTITVTAVDDDPRAMDDEYTTTQNVSIAVTDVMSGVLANDDEVDGQMLTVTTAGAFATANGFVSLQADGTFLYVPDSTFTGVDTFDYEVSDGVLTDTATVSITVVGETAEIPFVVGWNLFGWPLEEPGVLPGALSSIDGSYSNVWGYDAETETWLGYAVGVPAFFNDLTQLEFGRGYWILISQTVTATFGDIVGGDSIVQTVSRDVVSTVPSPPSALYGTVANGTAGLAVQAFVNGTLCGEGVTMAYGDEVVYKLFVVADAQTPQCGTPGATITITVDGITADETAQWNRDEIQQVDLTVTVPTAVGLNNVAVQTEQFALLPMLFLLVATVALLPRKRVR